jgi:spore germination protein GerM
VPYGLGEPPTTPPPTSSTTIPEITESTVGSSAPLVLPKTVKIYFLSGGKLKPEFRDVTAPIEPLDILNDLVSLLEAGPTGPSADLNTTAVPQGLINDEFRTARGVLTIDLDSRVFEEIDGRTNQRQAIAQIVFSFLTNLDGIGQVVFTVDGEPLTVPNGNGVNTNEPVALDDYVSMLVGPQEGQPEPTQPPETSVVETSSTTPTETSAP